MASSMHIPFAMGMGLEIAVGYAFRLFLLTTLAIDCSSLS